MPKPAFLMSRRPGERSETVASPRTRRKAQSAWVFRRHSSDGRFLPGWRSARHLSSISLGRMLFRQPNRPRAPEPGRMALPQDPERRDPRHEGSRSWQADNPRLYCDTGSAARRGNRQSEPPRGHTPIHPFFPPSLVFAGCRMVPWWRGIHSRAGLFQPGAPILRPARG